MGLQWRFARGKQSWRLHGCNLLFPHGLLRNCGINILRSLDPNINNEQNVKDMYDIWHEIWKERIQCQDRFGNIWLLIGRLTSWRPLIGQGVLYPLQCDVIMGRECDGTIVYQHSAGVFCPPTLWQYDIMTHWAWSWARVMPRYDHQRWYQPASPAR